MSSFENGRLYLIRNLVNGKGYIGQTISSISKRFSQHLTDAKRGSNFALHIAMRKYGVKNFSIIEIASCDIQFLNSLEEFLIVYFGTDANKGHGYNMAKGGHGNSGWHHSEETKLKIAHSKRGSKQTSEHIERAAAGKRGKRYRSFKNEPKLLRASGRRIYVK